MVQQQLVDFIKGMLKKGYNINSIKSQLLKYGYHNQTIDEAIHFIYSPKVKHEIHLSKPTLIAIAVLGIGLIIVAVSLILSFNQTSSNASIELNVDLITANVERGSYVEFNVNLVNFGGKSSDVTLNYNILDSSKKIIGFKTETTPLETRASLKNSIKVPADAVPGNYVLQVIADSGGKKISASESFTVSEKSEEIEAEIEQEIEQESSETEEIETEIASLPEKEEHVDEDDWASMPPEDPELEKARDLARKNPQNAVSYCNQLDNIEICYIEIALATQDSRYCSDIEGDSNRNYCYSQLAQLTGDSTMCSNIEDDYTRDDCYSYLAELTGNSRICKDVKDDSARDVCYTDFVMDGDYTLCGELTLDYLRDSCSQLKQLEEMKTKVAE